MEYILELLRDLLQDEESVRIAFVSLSAAAIFVFGLGIVFLVMAISDPVRRRLQLMTGTTAKKSNNGERIAKLVEPVSDIILPRKEMERSKVRTNLLHAGYTSSNAFTTFYAIKFIGAVVLPVLVLMIAPLYPELPSSKVVFFAILASFIGVILPNFGLNRKIEKRHRALRNAFPDALDLLVVCVEAGMGLNAAIQRVANELEVSHPELATEFSLVNAETQAGVDRIEALKNLAFRTGLDDIQGLVTLLAQSMRFGTSVADTLRVYSEEFRDKRMQRAEELAATLGTKMIFPLVTCFFPSFFLVAVGPAIVGVLAALAASG